MSSDDAIEAPAIAANKKKGIYERILQEIQGIVGTNNASIEKFELISYSRDASIADSHLPDMVVRPHSVEEIQKIMRIANREKLPVVPRANGSATWSPTIPVQGGIVMDTTGMNKIIEINEETMTITIEPGVTNWTMNKVLEEKGYEFGVIPISTGAATIVGNASSTGSSPIASGEFGTQADECTGLEVVLPNGDILRTGTMTNPACGIGSFCRHVYGPDITGLFLGAEGSLGIITKLTTVTLQTASSLGRSRG